MRINLGQGPTLHADLPKKLCNLCLPESSLGLLLRWEAIGLEFLNLVDLSRLSLVIHPRSATSRLPLTDPIRWVAFLKTGDE